MAKRGSAISVPESWLEQCRSWRKEQGLTLQATGVRLARAMKRGRPYAIATVQRYLKAELVTDELTEAFAKAMGVPHPVQVLEDENHQRWCELGVRLDKGHSETFKAELDRVERLVAPRGNSARSPRRVARFSHSVEKSD